MMPISIPAYASMSRATGVRRHCERFGLWRPTKHISRESHVAALWGPPSLLLVRIPTMEQFKSRQFGAFTYSLPRVGRTKVRLLI
jgi:hypothetical protein